MAGATDITKDLTKRISPKLADGLLLINSETKAVQELKIDDVRNLLAAFFSGAVIPQKISAGTVLGTPPEVQIYYAPAGSYTTPTGVVNLSGNLNMWFWNKAAWSYMEIPVAVDLSEIESNIINLEENTLKFADDQSRTPNAITYKAGNYLLAETELTGFPISGYISQSTGAVVASGSNTCTDFIPIPAGFTHLKMKMLVSQAGGAFFTAAQVFISGFAGTGAVATYAFPAGAAFYRASKNSSLTNVDAKMTLLKMATVTADQIAFIEGGDLTRIDILNMLQVSNSLLAQKYSKLSHNGDVIGENTILLDEGKYYTAKVAHTSYPNAGTINISTGAYTPAVLRKATDFVDLTGYSHILVLGAVINSVIGTAFYDSDQVFAPNSGHVNTGVEQLIKKPAGVKYARVCSTSTTGYLFLINYVENEKDTISFFDNGVKKAFKIKPNALEYADQLAPNGKAIAYKPGVYDVKITEYDLALMIAGFVYWASGGFQTSGSYKVTDFLDVTGFTHVRVAGMAASSSTGICFYNPANTYIYGTATLVDTNTEYDYPIPPTAKYVRVPITNSATNKIIKLIKKVTINENEIGFVDGEEMVIYKGGGGSVPISGNELIGDLPISNGADVTVGDAYIDNVSGVVIVKQ